MTGEPQLPVLLRQGSLDFPPVSLALREPNGLLAVGGDLSTERILTAYQHGIFPWYNPGEPILWWSPDPRLILYPDKIILSKSLQKRLKDRQNYRVSVDQAFEQVIRACAAPRSKEQDTWIDKSMIDAYSRLHRLGYAHSVEVWQDEALVGGLYGVSLGRAFFGESMFHRQRDCSKIALAHLARQLHAWHFDFIDCQMPTPHLLSLGAETLTRVQFIDKLRQTLTKPSCRGQWIFDG